MRRDSVHDCVIEPQFACIGLIEPGEDAEESSLTASGGAEEEKELARFDSQAHVIDCERGIKGFSDVG